MKVKENNACYSLANGLGVCQLQLSLLRDHWRHRSLLVLVCSYFMFYPKFLKPHYEKVFAFLGVVDRNGRERCGEEINR